MRVITWNMRKATERSPAWKILVDLQPDVALLQEVSGIPKAVRELFDIKFAQAVGGKNGNPIKVGTAVLVKGKIIAELPLSSEYAWVNRELARYKGDLVSCIAQPSGYYKLNIISVYSPAWQVTPSRLKGIDLTPVSGLIEKTRIWATELLLDALKNLKLKSSDRYLIGGDFNTSETFDFTWGKGNREYLDQMGNLGLIECLKTYNHKLTPTFKNPSGGKIIHQMDHLFVTGPLYSGLENCFTGNQKTIFGKSISDHLPIIADFKNIQITPSYIEKFIDRNTWTFAKTMAKIPHFYVVRDRLPKNDKEIFDKFASFIQTNGYIGRFFTKKYIYFNVGKYKYWVIENILNRAEI